MNRLTLKSEHLTDLTAEDLQVVVGGNLPTVKTYCDMVRDILNPPSNTWACTGGC